MSQNIRFESSPFSRSRILIIFAFVFALAFAFQGTRGIYAPDEGFYATIAKSMVETGDYFIPRLNHEVWLDKPPLSFWGIVAGLRFLGLNEWGARFFHALCYLLTIFVVFLLGRKIASMTALFFWAIISIFKKIKTVSPQIPRHVTSPNPGQTQPSGNAFQLMTRWGI